MSGLGVGVARVLTQKVSVQRIGEGARDALNTPTEEVTGTDEYMGRLVPVSAQEVLAGRDTVIVNEMLWLEPRAEVAATDRVVVDGKTYEIMAPSAELFGSPLVAHWELPVRRIVSG